MPFKKIDEALFTQMWIEGQPIRVIAAAIGLGRTNIANRAMLLDLAPRIKIEAVEPVEGQRTKYTGKPKAMPKPKREPYYQPGLSAAVQRAKEKGAERGDTAKRINWVATSYRVPYRDVLAMAGVAG